MQRTKKHRQSQDYHQIEAQLKANPRTRPVHAGAMSGEVINGDPKRKYIKANGREDQDFNYEYFEGLGYEIETHQKGGVSIKLGTKAKIGSPLKWKGMVLMSCSTENSERLFLEGETGHSGQSYQDKLYNRINQGQLERRVNIQGVHQAENWDQLNQMGGDSEVFR